MAKTETIHVRVEPEVKEKIEAIIKKEKLSTSEVLNEYLLQIIKAKTVPFKPKLKPVVEKKVTPKPVVEKKVTPKPVVEKKVAPKKVVEKKVTPKKVVEKKVAPKKAVEKKVTSKK